MMWLMSFSNTIKEWTWSSLISARTNNASHTNCDLFLSFRFAAYLSAHRFASAVFHTHQLLRQFALQTDVFIQIKGLTNAHHLYHHFHSASALAPPQARAFPFIWKRRQWIWKEIMIQQIKNKQFLHFAGSIQNFSREKSERKTKKMIIKKNAACAIVMIITISQH